MKSKASEREMAKIPEELRRLVNLTLIEKLEALDAKLRAEAEAKNKQNAEKIEALLVRLVPIDKDLRAKIEVFQKLGREYEALEDRISAARRAFADHEDELMAKVKDGSLTYAERQEQGALARAELAAKEREHTAKAAPLLKAIRDVDDEIKQLQIVWLGIETDVRQLTSEATISYLKSLEARVKEAAPSVYGFSSLGLMRAVKELEHQARNYKTNAVLWGLTLNVKAAMIPWTIFDSRIPDKYLPRLQEIIAEAAGKGRDINLVIPADSHDDPGIRWSFA